MIIVPNRMGGGGVDYQDTQHGLKKKLVGVGGGDYQDI